MHAVLCQKFLTEAKLLKNREQFAANLFWYLLTLKFFEAEERYIADGIQIFT